MKLLKLLGYCFIYVLWIIIGFLIALFIPYYIFYISKNSNITFWLSFLVLGIWFLPPPFIKVIYKKKKVKTVNVEEWNLDAKFSNLNSAELLNQGLIFLSRGSFEDAIDTFEKGLRKEPNDFKLHFRKGKAFMALGFYEKALECYKFALNLNPDDSVILSNVKITEYKISKESFPDELDKSLTELIEELYDYEEPSMIWNQEGTQLQMLGEFKDAKNYYKKAIKINKKNLYARRNLKRLRKISMNLYEFSL
jgi:tetratricopeptide (TPR) repeat protein